MDRPSSLVIAVATVQQPASAKGRPTSPRSCFYYTLASDTHNIVENGTTVGTYEADILYNSCQHTDHRAYGAMHLTAGACTSGTVDITWFANGVRQDGNSNSSSSIGPTNCSTTYISWESSSLIGSGYYICVDNVATRTGVQEKPTAIVCRSV